MKYSPESYTESDVSKLSEIWEPRKEYIEKDLWVIRDFLSPDELEWINKEANDPKDWYITMRSPYGGNIRNKFLGYIAEYDKDGNMLVPRADGTSEFIQMEYMGLIDNRLRSVLPEVMSGAGTLQSFFEVSDEQIFQETGEHADWAMGWHYERDDSDSEETQKTIVAHSKTQDKKILSQGMITASFNVYVNDNFDGGVLEFKNKDYSVKPEPGMLILFPSNYAYTHIAHPVETGTKYAVVTWLHDRN